MFYFDFDKATRVLTLTAVREWTLADVPPFERAASAQFAATRTGYGAVRLLLDITGAALFTQEVIDALTDVSVRIGRPDDRIATLVRSSLMKLQMKRVLPEEMAGVFVSRQAALMWLTAHDDDGGRGAVPTNIAA